jgi:hypothetical protein
MAFVIGLAWQAGCAKEQKAAEVKPEKAAVADTNAVKAEKSVETAKPVKAEETAKGEETKEAKESGRPEGPQPKIVFEKIVCDFGSISPGGKHSGGFKFTNKGKGVLRIGKIDSSCGCTVPKLTKMEYAPGESGEIKVEYSPGKSVGEARKTLTVATNDKDNASVTLTVAALVERKVECKPETINLSLKEPGGGCPKLTIKSLDNKPFAIKGFKSTGDSVSINYDPKVEKAEFIAQPKADIDKLQKNLNGHLEIELTHPECSSVSVSYTALPRFNVNPPSIVVFDAKPENPVKKQVTIVSNYGENFEIASTASQKGILKVLSQERGTSRWTLEVEVTPPSFGEGKPRMFTDLLTIVLSGGHKLEVTARGFYPSVKKQ